MYVYTSDGDYIPLDSLRIPKFSEFAGIFELHFRDEDYGNPNGFGGTNQNRRNTIINAFTMISNYLTDTLTYCNLIGDQKVHILIKSCYSSLCTNGQPVYGSQYYQEPGNGIKYGSIWRFINSGVDPFLNISNPLSMLPPTGLASDGAVYYHGELTVDFKNYKYLKDIPAGKYNLYNNVMSPL